MIRGGSPCLKFGDNVFSIGSERLLLRVMHEIDVELVRAKVFQLSELPHVILDGAQDTKAVYDPIGHEVGGGVVGPAVVAVIVALARPYVVGERVRDLAVLAVTRHQVGDVVADHPPEPPALVALVREVVTDVGRGGDAYLYAFGVAA